MDLYFERHDGQAVTIEDFLACFADATGADLTQFTLWYSQAGTPEVTARRALRRSAADLHPDARPRSCPPTPGQTVKQPMHIPVRFGLVGPNGEDLAYRPASAARASTATSSTSPSRARPSSSPACRRAPVPSLLRGFSAPVQLVDRPLAGRPPLPAPHRHRSVQPLAGGADAGRCAR